MTVKNILDRVDALMPNQYTEAQKMAWLSELDGKIVIEEILTHADYDSALEEFSGYDSVSDTLVIGFPYGEDIYTYFIEAMVCAQNAETAKYNMYITLYNAAYAQWTKYHNRVHMPLGMTRFLM